MYSKAVDREMDAAPTPPKVQASGSEVLLAALCLVVAFRQEVFFSAMAILGLRYEGAESSPVYIVFVGLVSALILMVACARVVVTGMLRRRDCLVFIVPLVFIAIYMLDLAMLRTQEASTLHFRNTIAFAVPAVFAGMVCAQRTVFRGGAYALGWIMLLFSAAVSSTALLALTGDAFAGVGGASYQTAAYLGGIAFNVNLYFILFSGTGSRLKFARPKAYRLFSYVLLVVQFGGVLLSGGRGGFALVAIGGAVQIAASLWSPGRNVLRKGLPALFVVLPMLVWVLSKSLADPDTGRIVARIFSWVGESGIDWEGTSGRGRIYGIATDALETAPVFGYGIFDWGMYTYPHNILLEWLLTGGMFLAVLGVLAVSAVFLKSFKWARNGATQAYILPLLLYPLVMLLFSGSYLTSGPFWFALAFVMCTSRADVELG
ncbi:MAG: O-antigen ligase family protein [Arachnia sp.]